MAENNGNTLASLRRTLFETLSELKNGEAKMPIDRAKAIVEVSDAIINTAKLELSFLNSVGDDRLPRLINPSDTVTFLEEDPRLKPQRKGLGTGKVLGS
jgi:hypothetical protein